MDKDFVVTVIRVVQNWFCKLPMTRSQKRKAIHWGDCEELIRKLQEVPRTPLEKENAILKLAVPLEDELADKITEMLKYLAMEDGFSLAGVARLFVDVQRRMAADWIEIGSLRRANKRLAEASAVPQPSDLSLRRLDTPENREFWASVAEATKAWEQQKPEWAKKLEAK